MAIVKRKKGTKEYFYLKHSTREGDKVITKEQYLGDRIPDNIKELEKQFMKKHSQFLYRKLLFIKNVFQKEWQKLPPSIKEKELQEIAIAFTYNTNAIEGSTITLDETRDIVKDHIAPRKSLDDIKETELHAKVFLEIIRERKILHNELLLQWHKGIFGETKPDLADKWRDYHVRVGYYRAPDWQDVPKLMTTFEKFLRSKQKINPVEFAGRVHYQFEKVHPFGDGNGRIGRLIINHMLWHTHYPMIIFEFKKRKQYYHALEKDEEGFAQWFMRMYLRVHKKRIVNSCFK
ncbi:Fic family protein [Candidatus Woesearchaeota archaeon]|nr:Fic family protein [Candidatus Woesearchaeota archaeon]